MLTCVSAGRYSAGMETVSPPPQPLPAPTTPPLGGYAVTRVRQHDGSDGISFSATITLHGQPVLRVLNAGEGGSNTYHPLSPRSATDALNQLTSYSAAIVALEEYAAEWARGREYAGFEDADALVDHLLTVAELNRARRVPFLLDDADFWATGKYCAFPASVSRPQVLEALRSPTYAGRRPRIWDPATAEFVPV